MGPRRHSTRHHRRTLQLHPRPTTSTSDHPTARAASSNRGRTSPRLRPTRAGIHQPRRTIKPRYRDRRRHHGRTELNTTRKRLLASLTLTLAAAACGTNPTTQHPPVITPDRAATTQPVTADTTARGLPTTVDIPSINVHATHLIALGLNKDGSPSTPPTNTPQILGYYGLGGPPCQPGPSKVPFVLIGHIDGNHQNGVFYQLKNLKPGATITINLDNRKSCTYRTTKLAEYKKQDLTQKNVAAAKQIWGPVTDGEIRMISCGGAFIGPPLYYQDNLVGMGNLT